MGDSGWAGSISTRLVTGFLAGGILLSLILSLLTFRHEQQWVQRHAATRLTLLAQRMQRQAQPLFHARDHKAIARLLQRFVDDPQIQAARLVDDTGTQLTVGYWPLHLNETQVWAVRDENRFEDLTFDAKPYTIMIAPIPGTEQTASAQLLIDRNTLAHQSQQSAFHYLAINWLVLAAMTLCGLIALRRWLNQPLRRIADLTRADADREKFHQTAWEIGGDLGDLADAIGGMLGRIDRMHHEINCRDQAYQDLFQFAPVALLSIGPDGRIVDANERAHALFGCHPPARLVGQEILPAIPARDRPRFRQILDRLEFDRRQQCELQLLLHDQTIHVAVQMAAVLDDHDRLVQARLSLVDISQSKQLIAQVTEQRRLLDLVLNHMSDAILLIDRDRRILTANQQLAQLLDLNVTALVGQTYDPVDLWMRLDPASPPHFAERLTELLNEPAAAGLAQFDTHSGSFSFQAVPVNDESGQAIGQLWVVQEVTAQVRNRRLLDQQALQLQALHHVGRQLHELTNVNQLLTRTTVCLQEMMDVEWVGIALRNTDPDRRCRQWIHSAQGKLAWPGSADLARAVSRQLMPRILADRATRYWTDLLTGEPWARPFAELGLEAVAATALFNSDQNQGLLWIARRGGRRIERHHLYLLEALAPMISTALHNAQLRDHLVKLDLTDPDTCLPSYQQFELMINHLAGDDQTPWAMMLITLTDPQTADSSAADSTGDRRLLRLADVLRNCCRSADLPCRYNHDTLAVLCNGTEASQAYELAQRIGAELKDAEADHAETISCAIGLACRPQDDADPAMLIHLAHFRLAQARRTSQAIVASGYPVNRAG